MNDTYLMLYEFIRDGFVHRFMGKMLSDGNTYFTMYEVTEIIEDAKQEVEEIIRGDVS